MVGSLLNIVNNLSEGIHRIKCKYNHDEKKKQNGKLAKLNISIASVSSNMQTLKKI